MRILLLLCVLFAVIAAADISPALFPREQHDNTPCSQHSKRSKEKECEDHGGKGGESTKGSKKTATVSTKSKKEPATLSTKSEKEPATVSTKSGKETAVSMPSST